MSLSLIKENIASIQKKASDWIKEAGGESEEFRIHFLGSTGSLKKVFGMMSNVAPEDRKEAGKLLNELKLCLTKMQHTLSSELSESSTVPEQSEKDISLPGIPIKLANRHPIEQVRLRIIEIFSTLGYSVEEAGEIEDDWHNFTALNMHEWHPARDMQDTFYIQKDPTWVLRTHTSNVQIRSLRKKPLPIRMIAPGRVYRNETISARSHCFFHQVEGMYVNEKVSFADLKHTLYFFVKRFFGSDTKIRFRPSYFPFTEPSAEMDISCFFCEQKGCSICKHSGWVEILGCGMMHPKVFESCNIDSTKYTGFAFGMGIERLTMLKYKIDDIRRFSENDLEFLAQFKG